MNKLLCSDVPPLCVPSGAEIIRDYFEEQISHSDTVLIVTGYASKNSLLKLDEYVDKYKIKNINVVLGMYYIEGCPESIYNIAKRIHEKWQHDGVGQIRVAKAMKIHSKDYVFYKNGHIISAMTGSCNLSAIVKDASTARQEETAVAFDDPDLCKATNERLMQKLDEPVSIPISDAVGMPIIHEENKKLVGVEGAERISGLDVATYEKETTPVTFDIPLKVPGIPDSTKDFMKSNVNKAYAKGRLNSRTGVVTERDWWETEIIVSKSITSREGYPEQDQPFYVVTDDGWAFKAHASGANKKNLESDTDLKILGYWLKGRLVSSGLIDPVDSPSADLKNADPSYEDVYENCKGVITHQKLKKYGRDSISMTKTTMQRKDENGEMLDVWLLSFLPDNVQ